MCGSCSTRPMIRRTSSAASALELGAVERHRARCTRRSARAPRRASTFRLRSVRPGRRAGPGSGRGRRRRAPTEPRGRSRARNPRMRTACSPDLRVGAGRSGSWTGTGASSTASIRAADRRAPSSDCAAVGRPMTSSNAASGISATTASITPSRRPSWTADDSERDRAPHREPRAERGETGSDARRACRRRRELGQLGVVLGDSRRAASVAPNATRSGAPSSRSTTAAVSSPRAGARRASVRCASFRATAGHDGGAREQEQPDGERRRRKQPPQHADRRDTDDGGDAPRGQDPQRDVLQGVDVAPPTGSSRSPRWKAAQPARGEPLEPFVDASTHVGEDPEGGVVPDEALAVAEEAAGQRRRTARRRSRGRGRRSSGAARTARSATPTCRASAMPAAMHAAPRPMASASRPRRRAGEANRLADGGDRECGDRSSAGPSPVRAATTRSTIASNAGRCATTTTVRPGRARVCSDSVTRASVSRVEVGGGLVEQEQRRVADERPRERDPLRAHPAERPAPRSPSRVSSSCGQLGDDGRRAMAADECAPELVVGGVAAAEPQVLGDRCREEVRVAGAPTRCARATHRGRASRHRPRRRAASRARGATKPSSTFNTVDLPQPLGPASATTSPGSIVSDHPSSAGPVAVRDSRPSSSIERRCRASRDRERRVGARARVTGRSSTSKIWSAALSPSALAW